MTEPANDDAAMHEAVHGPADSDDMERLKKLTRSLFQTSDPEPDERRMVVKNEGTNPTPRPSADAEMRAWVKQIFDNPVQ